MPDVYIFNPGCELEIANNSEFYNIPKQVQQFTSDLQTLPAYFAQENDFVICENQIPESFTKESEIFNNAVNFLSIGQLSALANTHNLSFNKLIPWGISPAVLHKLKALHPYCSLNYLQSPVAFTHENHKKCYSRKTASLLLTDFLQLVKSDLYISENEIPVSVTGLSEIETALKKGNPIVLKAPWSSSGRGVQILRKSALNTSVIQWINSTLQQQGFIMLEKYHKKVQDFSLHFYIDDSTITFSGISWFLTNSNGFYEGSTVGDFTQLLPADVLHILTSNVINQMADIYLDILKTSIYAKYYRGYLGIDAMLHLNVNNIPQIQPCIEVNCRYNMGILSILLGSKIHPEAKGYFKIFHEKNETFGQFIKQHNNKIILKQHMPYSGVFQLTPTENSRFGAYLQLY